MSRRTIEPLGVGAVGGVRAEFEDEGRSIGQHLFRRLLGQAAERGPLPEGVTLTTVRDVDPAAMLAREAEQLLDAPGGAEPVAGAAAFRNQKALAFTNNSDGPAEGLYLWFAAPTTVFVEPGTGNAGPFQDIAGNGTTHIQLTNPAEIVASASTLMIKLRSQGEVVIQEWGWLHPGMDLE